MYSLGPRRRANLLATATSGMKKKPSASLIHLRILIVCAGITAGVALGIPGSPARGGAVWNGRGTEGDSL
jgi:hypothetical protein